MQTVARREGEAWVLDGVKAVVQAGESANVFVVSARTAGAIDAEEGISLFLVPKDAPGVSVLGTPTMDGGRVADVTLKNVQLTGAALLGEEGKGYATLERAVGRGILALCAEALGAMEAAKAATLDYLRTRKQFGVPIGSFQALQHRMADMFIHLEQARSMAMLAAVKLGSQDAAERRRAVSAAKYRVNQAARYIGQQAVQLHGGMGVTDELPASHYFKRLATIELTLGDADHHLARFVAQPGFREGAAA